MKDKYKIDAHLALSIFYIIYYLDLPNSKHITLQMSFLEVFSLPSLFLLLHILHSGASWQGRGLDHKVCPFQRIHWMA